MIDNPSRRRFLNRLSLAAGTIAISGSPLVVLAQEGESRESHYWRGQRRWIRPGRGFFPQSVASFEPRTDSLIVWTRLQDSDYFGQDLELTLLVATDPWLHRIVVASKVIAHASDDGVAQVKLTDLKAKTHYYYRFVYGKAGQYLGSAIGRAKTPPQPQDGSPVRFGLANCQDAIGRYYNTYFAALVQDLDFVVHVGDYIYETTGDPSFQAASGRGVVFTDTAGAIALEAPSGSTYYAAASVSNYRELYRFYRSDPLLQRMHERFTFLNIWDDHEYSDDCWGDTATYFDGLSRSEKNTARRRNAETVFLTMGKIGLLSSLGSRYFVLQATYDLYAAFRTLLLRDAGAENAYGEVQLLWLEHTLKASDAHWKLVANSTSLTSMILDLTGQSPDLPQPIKDALARLPAQLRNRFYLNVDQFDGFPNFRRRLLDLYASIGGVALVAGDVHASFVAKHAGGVWELTAPAVSSSSFRAEVLNIVGSDPTLSQVPGVADLVAQIDLLLPGANPEIRYVNTAVNGVVTMQVSSDKIEATYWQIDGAEATTSYYERPGGIVAKLIPKHVVVRAAGPVADGAAPTSAAA